MLKVKGNAIQIPISIKKELSQGAYLKDKTIHFNITQNPFTMSIDDLALQGKHNAYNSMAAGISARVLEIRKEIIRESLSDFENIEHRLEFVAKINGIDFINDSKATNVNSTWYALESMQAPTVWIVGGQDKGNDYDMLLDLVKEKVKAIVCLGVDNSKIISAFSKAIPNIVEAQSADAAVQAAYRIAKKGETVLLSPACASFDLFENYEDRGRQFKHAVRRL
jgi:UDP-N-acetylmuramoylalanine--D-glutamate ligase